MTLPHKSFYFIRHGETDWNKNRIYMGSQDIPLNQWGREQAKLATKWLKEEPIDYIVASPLKRASQTAEIIGSTLKKPITIIDDLKECGCGIHEGQPVDDGTFFQKWLKGNAHESVEKADVFQARVMRGMQKALELPGSILIVAHGGVYRTIQQALQWPMTNLKNCLPLYHRPPEHPTHPWFVCPLADEESEHG